MDWLSEIAEAARRALDESNAAREETLALSREIIRTSANTILFLTSPVTSQGEPGAGTDTLPTYISLPVTPSFPVRPEYG